MKLAKLWYVVSVWLDETFGPESTAWCVSRDGLDEGGRAETTETIKYWRLGQYPDARDRAVAYGTELAAKRGLPLVIEKSARD